MKKGTIDNYMITLLRYACTIIGAALIGNAFGNMNAGRPKQGLKLVLYDHCWRSAEAWCLSSALSSKKNDDPVWKWKLICSLLLLAGSFALCSVV